MCWNARPDAPAPEVTVYLCVAPVDMRKQAAGLALLVEQSLGRNVMLAHLVTAKYVHSLPLHHQEAIFARHGVSLPRATQAAWIIAVAQLAQPLLNLMDERIHASGYIRIDETPEQVLNSEKSPTAEHWMWVRVAGPSRERLILFDYDPSRSAQVAERLLEGASGYFQSDGYAVYDGVAARLNLLTWGALRIVPSRI